MNNVNVINGLIKSKFYLLNLEKVIKNININEYYDIEQYDDLKKYQNDFFNNISCRFYDLKDYKVSNTIKKEAYYKSMLGNSSRIRPLLLFLGNLCSKQTVDKKILLNCGLSIEMIHKMSLILDDYFDNDLKRKGQATFHTIYDERIMLETVKMLLNLSNNIFFNSIKKYDTKIQEELVKLYKQIIFDMGEGFLLDLDRKDKYISIDDTNRINNLQSSTIIKNSLLIGYCLSNNNIHNYDYSLLSYIGVNMGRIFQSFNDIENFVNEEEQLKDKGSLYTDLKENRKNVVLARVPKYLFYNQYTNEEIIKYIKENNLPQQIIEELLSNIEDVQNKIAKLSSSIGKDTIMMVTNDVSKKTLKKLKIKS